MTLDRHYGIKEGAQIKWTDSICYRMVEGLGPNIAPDLERVPAYKQAPIAQRIPISAYIGFPLLDSDGQLFGTLAAIDPLPQSDELLKSERTLQLFSKLISTHISLDLQIRSQSEKSDTLDEILDPETKLLSHFGWSRFLEAQNRRTESVGMQSYMASIVFEDNSVETVLRAQEPIRRVLGPNAVLARGNNNQILLCIPCFPKEQGDRLMQELLEELHSTLKSKEVAIQTSR
ncbi:MAG: hypothetical protein U0930_19930 [Pirellulales bacterium]